VLSVRFVFSTSQGLQFVTEVIQLAENTVNVCHERLYAELVGKNRRRTEPIETIGRFPAV
jgi:hypothetical protein